MISIYFFFCKQKTAYEMRISDWSSDVCSSDLRLFGTPVSTMKHISGDRGEEENADYSVCVLVQKCCRYVVAFLRNMRLKAHGVPAVFTFGSLTTVSLAVRYRYAFLIGWEIGRASCRDRVCQYV